MSEINLFEVAVKKRYRFESVNGALMLEDLYSLPLIVETSKRHIRASLDQVARHINEQIKALQTDSFVEPSTKDTADLINKLELVKLIIAEKKAEIEAANERQRRRQKRQQINDALEAAQNRELGEKSVEDLKKMLDELND